MAAATQTLAELNAQAEALRAELVRLRLALAEVERETSAARSIDLLEANEKLVLAALQAETIAEAAARNLAELARSSQRDPLTDAQPRADSRSAADRD